MQASMGITRLLALSLLLHSVGSQTTTMTPTDGNTSKTEPVSVSVTADPSGAADNLTKPTESTPTSATMVNPTSAPVTVKATDNPATTQPQSTAPATNPASPSAATVVARNDTVETTDPSATPAAATGSVVSTPAVTSPPNLPVATTPQPLSSNAPSGTTASDAVSVGTTVSGNQASTLSASKAGQVGKEKTTEASKGPEQTTLTTSNMGGAGGPQGGLTSSTPSSTPLTKTSPQTAGTSSTKAGGPAPTDTTTTTTAAAVKTFSYSYQDHKENDKEDDLVKVCQRLMTNFNLDEGNCTLTLRHHDGAMQLDSARINGKVKTELAKEIYQDITKKPTDNKTLIAILASCGALLIMIVILAVCASHHRKPFNENQQHLTEELHTVENGYHDNPTLEVMEVQPEMQEKKMALNGEFNDSWIVPIDNLLKEDMPDEEDTHL